MHPRTTPLPAHLADAIWTVEHVALAFRLGARATRALVAAPGLPGRVPHRPPRAPPRCTGAREQVIGFISAPAELAGVLPAGVRDEGDTAAASAARAPRQVAPVASPADEDGARAAIAALRRAPGAAT